MLSLFFFFFARSRSWRVVTELGFNLLDQQIVRNHPLDDWVDTWLSLLHITAAAAAAKK
jgi:hypothetical protein